MANEQIVKRLDWRTLMSVGDDTPDDVLAALDAYFEPFSQFGFEIEDGKQVFIEEQPCNGCGKNMTPSLADQILGDGGFTWGLVHGEGHCRSCGWPARLYHFIKDSDGEELLMLRNVLLQYHPDFVERRATA